MAVHYLEVWVHHHYHQSVMLSELPLRFMNILINLSLDFCTDNSQQKKLVSFPHYMLC